MKPGNLLLMVLIVVLATAVAAPAITLHTPWEFGHREESLAQIISAWGFPVDNNALRHAIPLESLSAGDYSIDHYAVDPGKSRPRGMHPPVITLPGRGHQPDADGIRLLIPKKSGSWECDLAFTETADFGFFETANRTTILLTTQNHPSATKPFHQSGGLIFDLGEINPLYAGQYIIAFEEGRNHHPWCSLDYNDLVVHVHRLNQGDPMPLPGTLPLLGGGLLTLVLFRFCQRRFASAA
ncbi:MAG: hypothetical protein A2139_07095 [Desulfobacca sp. RBG_16_60_12]|nr:MAG: hypothetical protein A2139_07095 [Desulfobacca sp. RBG_16_60_12]